MNLNKAPDPDLWISCLELARLLIDKDVDFCLDLKIGNQSFSLDTKKSRKHLDFSDPTGRRSKHKSASTLKRDKLRLERFLARKSGGRKTETSWDISSPSSGLVDRILEKPMGQTSQELPDESQEGAEEDSVVPGSNYDRGESSSSEAIREGQQMGIKELGRRVTEGLDELMRKQQQRLEEEKNWGFSKPKVSSKGIKCRCCDEIISDVNHTCDTYDSLCEKINQGKINSLTDYQANLLESHMHSSSIFKV